MKFIEQRIKLPVYNVDLSPSLRTTRRHGALFPNTVRALVVGSSGCGKTNVMYFLLVDRNRLRFSNVYLYAKTLEQPKYQFLKCIIDGVDGVNIFFPYAENDEVVPPDQALPNSVFVFDDIVCESQNIIRQYFSRGRYGKIDVFYLAQSYSKIPKQLIRDNANLIIMFKQDETNLRHVYREHCSSDMSYTDFKKFCDTCWNQDRFLFVVICKDDERDNDGGGRTLNELIKTKENIRHKFDELKKGEANVRSLVSQTFEPIIKPLTQLSDTRENNINRFL